MPSLPVSIMLEKEGHTGRATIPLSNQYPELGIRRETIPDQVIFCCSNSIGFPLKLRQLANEGQDQRDVFDTCLANFQHGLQVHPFVRIFSRPLGLSCSSRNVSSLITRVLTPPVT